VDEGGLARRERRGASGAGVITLFALVAPLLALGNLVTNGDFEAKAGKSDPIPGWVLVVGARNGAEEPLSTVRLDTKEKRKGRASLLVSGDDTTRAWRSVQQELPVRPGGKYRLTAWARAENVRPETVRGTSIQQFNNCFVGLILYDTNGEVVGKGYGKPGLPTSGWQKLSIEVAAPDTARKALVSVSLTMSGSLWVDEVELAIEGGQELAAPEVLLREDFEKTAGVPAGWEESVGAHNGDGPSRSTITVDKSTGASGSHASLHFSGERRTIQWYGLGRKFDAAPGDAFAFRAMVRAKDVNKEGIQFANLHIRLVFLDAEGKTVGTPKFGQPGDGTYDWKEVSVSNAAPEGAKQVLAGIFLSMSGDAWFDDLAITKQAGGRPAYADWQSVETKHVVLRYPNDHPRAKEMKAYGARLDSAYEDIVKRLAVDYSDRITVFLYRDEEQGKNLTGRDLDFSNPEGKAVHQRSNSTLGHEMVHCIALKIGVAQTALLGEGIAVYLNGAPPEEHHKTAAQLLEKGDLPSMKALLEDFRGQANGYPAAGSFCGYLVEMFGMEKFKQLYPMTDPAAGAESVLGKSLEAVDADWRESLKVRH
jgi:hypothetical protein